MNYAGHSVWRRVCYGNGRLTASCLQGSEISIQMKTISTSLFIVFSLFAFGQTPDDTRVVPPLRQQTFGITYAKYDILKYEFDTSGLVYFDNGYLITREEFNYVLREAHAMDTSEQIKKRMLSDFILARQKVFEAMDQDLDTAKAFQLNFLMYKQELITPYLNEGKTRLEAEAIPEVKFALRKYYSDEMIRVLNIKEIWSQDTDENLRPYFNGHPELYQGQPYEISKTKVVHDLNKKLETDLNARVTGKFQFVVNPADQR